MTRPRAEYARRMHRVLAHIDAHLAQPLDLAGLAQVAHFSPFHFHRLFTAWMGETLGDYLRRRRLEVAALRLLTQPHSTVLDIALAVGFGSNEAFARAFKARFGCSASAWRRLKAEERAGELSKFDQEPGNPDQDAEARGAEDDGSSTSLMELAMKVKITERQPVRVAYLRHVGPYGATVHAFWERKFRPFIAQRGLGGRPMYGISHDDPNVTAADRLRYDAAVEVDEAFVPSGEAQVTTIAGGRCAVMPFYGTSQAIGAAWTALLRDWLPGSGYQLDARPCFEHYLPGMRHDEATHSFECEIVIPLAPL